MEARKVLQQGFRTRHETGDAAKIQWMAAESCRRFLQLTWVLEARKLNLVTANRRWRRRNGKPLH